MAVTTYEDTEEIQKVLLLHFYKEFYSNLQDLGGGGTTLLLVCYM